MDRGATCAKRSHRLAPVVGAQHGQHHALHAVRSKPGPATAQGGLRGAGMFATPPEGFWEEDEEVDLILQECPLSNNFP